MKVKCPHCNGVYEVENKYVGQKIQCLKCENLFEAINSNLF